MRLTIFFGKNKFFFSNFYNTFREKCMILSAKMSANLRSCSADFGCALAHAHVERR